MKGAVFCASCSPPAVITGIHKALNASVFSSFLYISSALAITDTAFPKLSATRVKYPNWNTLSYILSASKIDTSKAGQFFSVWICIFSKVGY